MQSNPIEPRVGGRLKADALRNLSDLVKLGILTRREFERQKATLLGRRRDGDESDRAEALIADALTMLIEGEAPFHPPETNVVSFESRKRR